MKKHSIFFYLSILFLVLGLGSGGYLLYKNYQDEHLVQQAKTNFQVVDKSDILTDKEKEQSETIQGNTAVTTSIDSDNRGLTIGKMAMPSIGVSLPIYKGEFSPDGSDNMLLGAVTNKENQEMGFRNYVLSSHIVNNKQSLFTSLTDVHTGDVVYLTDGETLFTYTISKEFVVKPTDTYILDDIDNQATLTLYTCNYINEFKNGEQLTDRTVRFGNLTGQEPLTQDLNDTLFGF